MNFYALFIMGLPGERTCERDHYKHSVKDNFCCKKYSFLYFMRVREEGVNYQMAISLLYRVEKEEEEGYIIIRNSTTECEGPLIVIRRRKGTWAINAFGL